MNNKVHTIKSYLRHLLKAKGRHSIHSPFLYNIFEDCITNFTKPDIYIKIEEKRKVLLRNENTIYVEDFGAGSRVHKSNNRKINEIAKHSLKSKKEAMFLASFIQKIDAKNIIELGTSQGITTAYIATLNPKTKIQTIEGSSEISKIAKSIFDELNLTNIELMTGSFDLIFPKILNKNIDLVFIDGNHTKEATLKYFELAVQKMNENGFVIFDDIYWSPQMTEAWKDIISDSRVTLSVDLFKFGIISTSKNFSKENFKLRF